MKKSQSINEKFLYEIWKNQNFTKGLITKDGQNIEVINIGIENKELSGPDFKNAKIKIGNITFTGDVEIDIDHADWKSHGHNLNKKYNSVILHAVLNDIDRNNVYTSEGRKIPSVSIINFLQADLAESIKAAIISESKKRINKMPCMESNSEITEKDKLNFVYDLGINRFKHKKEKFLERLKELIYLEQQNLKEPIIRYELDEKFYNKTFNQNDFNNQHLWQQLIYESIFEALGYSKNKEIMKSLAKAADIKFLSTISNQEFISTVESVLFNIGGLMPDVIHLPDEETSVYTKKLYEIWNGIKNKYDGIKFNAAQWHFFKLRPQNFPTVRLAGGARILKKIMNENLIGKITDAISQKNKDKDTINYVRSLFIIKSDGFWKNHYVFDQPAKVPINYFIGSARADEILVNIILPVITLYFEIFGKKELSQKTIKIFLNFYQNSENNLVNEVSSTLSLNDAWKRSVLYQGMIELFRNFCSRDKCHECYIGQKIFS
ncbi:MAG: DUF2851 family protein [Bacteroidetes bacterium]|nr:DUF2851 family protein [Bacteroidota bacterium]